MGRTEGKGRIQEENVKGRMSTQTFAAFPSDWERQGHGKEGKEAGRREKFAGRGIKYAGGGEAICGASFLAPHCPHIL